jgi:membrane-associated protein
MHRLTDWLLGLHGLPVYGLVGLLVFAEDALFVGFVLAFSLLSSAEDASVAK